MTKSGYGDHRCVWVTSVYVADDDYVSTLNIEACNPYTLLSLPLAGSYIQASAYRVRHPSPVAPFLLLWRWPGRMRLEKYPVQDSDYLRKDLISFFSF